MSLSLHARPPLPPFTHATAIEKVRKAEDGWNSRDPVKVSLAYTPDSVWRNRSEFVHGRTEIVDFLKQVFASGLLLLAHGFEQGSKAYAGENWRAIDQREKRLLIDLAHIRWQVIDTI